MVKIELPLTRRWLFHFLLLGASCHLVHAQKIESVSLALQTGAIAIPFTRLTPLQPGIEVGVGLSEKVRPKTTRRWNAYAGWFYHENMDHNIYLRAEYEIAFNIGNTISVFTPMGLGYMHAWHPKPAYKQNSDGSFSEKTQIGRPHAIANVGLGARYLGSEAWEPFIKYEALIQTPFVSTVPAGPRSFLKVGVNFKLPKQ
ncbi:MAG: hypothetical protein AAGA85_23790 [Bacteroidota bacterium]